MANFSGEITQGVPFIRYPHNLGQPPYDKFIVFDAKAGRHVLRNQILVENNKADATLRSVGLYLSESTMKSSLQVAYDKNDLGPMVGAAVELLAQTGTNLYGAKAGGGSIVSSLSALKDKALKLADTDTFKELLKVEGFKFLEGLGADFGVENAAGVLFGQKPNPRTDILFNTQQYRTHELEFMLIPRSLEEAKTIDALIYFFQFYMLPRYQGTVGTDEAKIGAFMIGFPYEFEISLLSAGPGATVSPMSHVNRIGRSVLTDVAFDHAAGGKTAFVKENGDFYPVATALKLAFQEVRLLARDSDEIKRADDTPVMPERD